MKPNPQDQFEYDEIAESLPRHFWSSRAGMRNFLADGPMRDGERVLIRACVSYALYQAKKWKHEQRNARRK
ncbi:MAG: hypothetical protein LBK60_03045 [Verrucomicrobiales bacterium]|jgi:hypothetical protein|nr:hypothetical protein [Verrucomicrobiales bacterium]